MSHAVVPARPLYEGEYDAGVPGLGVAQAIRSWSWLAVFSLLGVLLPTMLVSEIPNGVHRSQAWVVGLAIMVWSAAHLATSMVRGTPRLFHFFFWLFNYIFFGLAATCQLRSGDIPWTTLNMDPGLDLPAMGVLFLGMICFEIGGALSSYRERGVTSRANSGTIHRGRALLMSLAGFGIAAMYLARVGISKAWVSREEGAILQGAAFPDQTVWAIATAMATFPLLIGVGALMYFARTTTSRSAKVGYLLLAVAGATLELMINSPTSSARYTFGTVAFAVIIYTGWASTLARTRLMLVGTTFAFLFLFPLANAFRTTGGSHERKGFFVEYPGNPDYDAFWMIGNAISYWQDGRVQPFRQLLGSLLFWLPRSVWTDKPTDTAIELANFRGYEFTNLSAPLWSEALVNGGIVFLVPAFFLIGWGLHSLDCQFERTFRSGGWWILLMGVFPVYFNILLRGSLLQATGSLAVAVAACLFVKDWSRKPLNSGLPAGPPDAD